MPMEPIGQNVAVGVLLSEHRQRREDGTVLHVLHVLVDGVLVHIVPGNSNHGVQRANPLIVSLRRDVYALGVFDDLTPRHQFVFHGEEGRELGGEFDATTTGEALLPVLVIVFYLGVDLIGLDQGSRAAECDRVACVVVDIFGAHAKEGGQYAVTAVFVHEPSEAYDVWQDRRVFEPVIHHGRHLLDPRIVFFPVAHCDDGPFWREPVGVSDTAV